MDLLSRYRNITVLLLVIFAQLVLLGYQVKSNQDIRLIRVWAVTAVTPIARAIESIRGATSSSFGKYVNLHNLADENKDLAAEVGKLKLQNQYLEAELRNADRAVALRAFQQHNTSKTMPSRVIGTGTGTGSRVVFIDRGSGAGVMRGMAVITPDGIVGKVIAAYPTASQVLLITDPNFAAGVISQKHRVRGTVKGLGQSKCTVRYVQNEERVDSGEWFYTYGDDGVFPRGLPVGTVTGTPQEGNPDKQVLLAPSGLQGGPEEVLIILEGMHQPIPEGQIPDSEIHLQPPPADGAPRADAGAAGPVLNTDADRLRQRYEKIGEAQGHKFGEGTPGSKPPDFNLNPEEAAALAARAAAATAAQAAKPDEGTPPGAAATNPAPQAPKP